MKSIKKRAKDVDLIEIPKGLAERCSNCSFIEPKTGFCTHPEVKFEIIDPDNKCCKEWDNPAIDRSKTQ